MEQVTLTAQPQELGAAYRIAYDGRIMGDDRGFSTLAECEAEIALRIATDQRDAVRYDRPIMYKTADTAQLDRLAAEEAVAEYGRLAIEANDAWHMRNACEHAECLADKAGVFDIEATREGIRKLQPSPTLKRYLIEGASDGSLFTEAVDAPDLETAEAMAIERLQEAWGQERDTLAELGDATSVREYSADDYARDAAPELLAALKVAERHIASVCDETSREDLPDWFADLEMILATIAAASAR